MTRHSTQDAVTTFLNDVIKVIEENKLTVGILLDLSKESDTKDHTIILNKFEHNGINGISLDWVKSYLSEGKQFVAI